mgnify:CR=1 FL=1
MAQYKYSNITELFWAGNDGFKSGRDPMGIQNSSIATYGCLLPGMTNLTGHIRYYSLYCWLLSEYDYLEQQGFTTVHQYNFIRRAELILAFIMKGQDVRSVVGADFARNKCNTILDEEIYDIAKGADYGEKEKYWSFKSGAFGQYYLGSLIYYNLVKIESGRFYLRNKGKELAKTVVDSVDEDVCKLMLECIIEGELSESEILELKPLGINSIIPDSSEWAYLNNLLTKQYAVGSNLRRETIYLILKDYEKGKTTTTFVSHRYLEYKRGESEMEAAFGWYFYYLCEALHYGIESIFCYVLDLIDKLQNPPVSVLLETGVETLFQQLEDEQVNISIADLILDYNGEIDVQLSKLKTCIKHQDYAEAVAEALRLFVCLYQEYQDNKEAILKFEQKYDLIRQRGILSEGLKEYLERYIHLSVKEYLEKVIRQVMNEHTCVAIAKMGNSDLDLRKFILENGCAFLVEMRYPNETNPRIETLHNFLVDLGYLTIDNKLTSIANHFLSEYSND